ncbi:hypothetical protein MTO96_011689 [Rhipicephalus appendiculatus]
MIQSVQVAVRNQAALRVADAAHNKEEAGLESGAKMVLLLMSSSPRLHLAPPGARLISSGGKQLSALIVATGGNGRRCAPRRHPFACGPRGRSARRLPRPRGACGSPVRIEMPWRNSARRTDGLAAATSPALSHSRSRCSRPVLLISDAF